MESMISIVENFKLVALLPLLTEKPLTTLSLLLETLHLEHLLQMMNMTAINADSINEDHQLKMTKQRFQPNLLIPPRALAPLPAGRELYVHDSESSRWQEDTPVLHGATLRKSWVSHLYLQKGATAPGKEKEQAHIHLICPLQENNWAAEGDEWSPQKGQTYKRTRHDENRDTVPCNCCHHRTRNTNWGKIR